MFSTWNQQLHCEKVHLILQCYWHLITYFQVPFPQCGLKLWDLTFWVDHYHIFGSLQFKNWDRHQKIQMEGHFYTSNLISIDPNMNNVVFYHKLTWILIPDHTVSMYMQLINNCLRYVLFCTLHTLFLTFIEWGSDQMWWDIWIGKFVCCLVNTYQLYYECNLQFPSSHKSVMAKPGRAWLS